MKTKVEFKPTLTNEIQRKKLAVSIMKNAFHIGNKLIAWIPVELLDIKPYQRNRQRHVTQIAENWDDTKCNVLLVSYDEITGCFNVTDKLQGIFSRSDRNTTLHYIGIAREDEIKLYNDMGDFITDVDNGKKPVIKNSPVVPLKAEDFREILSKCWDMAQNGEDKFNGKNIYSLTEDIRNDII